MEILFNDLGVSMLFIVKIIFINNHKILKPLQSNKH